MGAYEPGSDLRVDEAIALWPKVQKFLSQSYSERISVQASIDAMSEALRLPDDAGEEEGVRIHETV